MYRPPVWEDERKQRPTLASETVREHKLGVKKEKRSVQQVAIEALVSYPSPSIPKNVWKDAAAWNFNALAVTGNSTGFLEAYGYAPADEHNWQSCGGSESPRIIFNLEENVEQAGHTWYILECELWCGQGKGSAHLTWYAPRRLHQLRDLHHCVKVAAVGYAAHFEDAHFAKLGAPKGTTERMHGWLQRLADLVNALTISPETLALVLRFLCTPDPPCVERDDGNGASLTSSAVAPSTGQGYASGYSVRKPPTRALPSSDNSTVASSDDDGSMPARATTESVREPSSDGRSESRQSPTVDDTGRGVSPQPRHPARAEGHSMRSVSATAVTGDARSRGNAVDAPEDTAAGSVEDVSKPREDIILAQKGVEYEQAAAAALTRNKCDQPCASSVNAHSAASVGTSSAGAQLEHRELTEVFEASFDEQVQKLGFAVAWETEQPHVQKIDEGGAASVRGILAGDRLVEINSVSTQGRTRDELMPLLKVRPLRMMVIRPLAAVASASQPGNS